MGNHDCASVRRWAYVRDCLAQAMSLQMDGTAEWRFRPIYRHRAATVEAAVDMAIEEAIANGYKPEE